jgi:hypothetical protein
MEEFVPFASRSYVLLFLLLFVSRGMDFLSTWVATPNLVLEGNPIAKRLGDGALNVSSVSAWPSGRCPPL